MKKASRICHFCSSPVWEGDPERREVGMVIGKKTGNPTFYHITCLYAAHPGVKNYDKLVVELFGEIDSI